MNARRNETTTSNDFSVAEATPVIRLSRIFFGQYSAKAQNSAAAAKFGGCGVYVSLMLFSVT